MSTLFLSSKGLIRDYSTLILFSFIFIFSTLFVVRGFNHGFDISDESLYLMWSKNPHEIVNSFRSTPHILNIAHKLVDFHIVHYRITGCLFLLLSGMFFAYNLVNITNYKLNTKSSFCKTLPTLLVISISSLLYYTNWVSSPSYNLLSSVLSLLLGGILLRLLTKPDIDLIFSQVAYGILNFILIICRWPSGIVFMFFYLIIFIFFNKFKINNILLLRYFTGLFISGFFYFTCIQSFENWLNVFVEGFNVLNMQIPKSESSVLIILRGYLNEFVEVFLTSFKLLKKPLVIIFLFLIVSRFNKIFSQHFLFPLYLLIALLLCIDLYKTKLYFTPCLELIPWTCFFVLLFIHLIINFKKGDDKKTISFLVILLLSMFIAPMFGTKFALFSQLHNCMVPLVSLLVFLSLYLSIRTKQKWIFPFWQILFITLTSVQIIASTGLPRRQSVPLFKQNFEIKVLGTDSILKVSNRLGLDIKSFQDEIIKTNYIIGDDVIGLYRASSLIYFIGGNAPGNPYLFDDYPGTVEYISRILSLVDKERVCSSWIIIKQPKDIRAHFSPDPILIFDKIDIDFESNFKMQFSTEFKSDGSIIEFWKPNNKQ